MFPMINKHLSHPVMAKLANLEAFGKSPAGLYLRLNQRIWDWLPVRVREFNLLRSYGEWLHALVCLRAQRRVYVGTYFLRNRPALELMRRIVERDVRNAKLRIAVLGCSIGAEVYSILWVVRSERPDLKATLHAVDISEEVLKFAERGIYGPDCSETVGASIFERLTAAEQRKIFDWDGDQAEVKGWLRDGIIWKLGDALDPQLLSVLGPQHIVVASNFLCHLAPPVAEKCLRNIARLVEPDGYIFVSGVDLDVRTRVAIDLGWKPVLELLPEIHEGDPVMRADWPWQWWGLEPLDKRRPDWQIRYAAAFQVK
jgi:SAM-dependent methyltransferase